MVCIRQGPPGLAATVYISWRRRVECGMDTSTEASTEAPAENPLPKPYRGVGIGKAPGSAKTQFKKGNNGSRGRGRTKLKAAVPMPTLLRDLRAVYGQQKKRDRTPGQKVLRQIFESNFGLFLDRLQKAEYAHSLALMKAAAKAEKAHEISRSSPETDEGTERCLALCNKLLQEAAELQAKEDAKLPSGQR